jgi:hypothetical protein
MRIDRRELEQSKLQRNRIAAYYRPSTVVQGAKTGAKTIATSKLEIL